MEGLLLNVFLNGFGFLEKFFWLVFWFGFGGGVRGVLVVGVVDDGLFFLGWLMVGIDFVGIVC